MPNCYAVRGIQHFRKCSYLKIITFGLVINSPITPMLIIFLQQHSFQCAYSFCVHVGFLMLIWGGKVNLNQVSGRQ